MKDRKARGMLPTSVNQGRTEFWSLTGFVLKPAASRRGRAACWACSRGRGPNRAWRSVPSTRSQEATDGQTDDPVLTQRKGLTGTSVVDSQARRSGLPRRGSEA